METTIAIPTIPLPKKETVPVVDAVARSIAREDAFMKPGSMGKSHGRGTNATRIRMSNPDPKSRPRKKKHDPRDVKFW